MQTTGNQPMRAGRELAVGSAWMIGMRWAIRGVGLLSTVILARLLAPDDFGVVAMAMVAVAILQAFTQSGTDLALLRAETPERGHYDAAWTLEIIQGAALAAALFLTAPLVAGQFEDPRVTAVIRAMSLAPFISGFQNIGVVNFRRELNFRREFLFNVYKRLATFVITVTAALLMRSYWAMVLGYVVGRAIEVTLSYVMSSYRPRLSLSRAGEIWGFSKWLVLTRFSMVINRQFDRWVVGSMGGAASMGNYFIAQDFASSPSDEVIAPMSRAAFPVYSRMRERPAELANAFHRMLSSVVAIAFATGLGMAAVAEDFVHVVLGSKWLGAIPLMPWLGLFAAVFGISRALDTFLLATGRERMSSLMGLAYALVTIPVIWMAGRQTGIEGIAAAKAATAVVLVSTLVVAGTRAPPLTLRLVVSAAWPPIVSAAMMFSAVKALQATVPVDSHVFGLLRDAIAGAIVYIGCGLVIWLVRGRPAGIEQDLVNEMRRRLRRWRGH
jgi:lipopolysaccharide exporter